MITVDGPLFTVDLYEHGLDSNFSRIGQEVIPFEKVLIAGWIEHGYLLIRIPDGFMRILCPEDGIRFIEAWKAYLSK